jgi:fructokinase
MLVGVDWGGTKIEAIAIDDTGRPISRLREATPRSDYEGCLETIASLVSRVEAEAGATGSVGVGIPGSVDPRTGVAKGASSTWLN